VINMGDNIQEFVEAAKKSSGKYIQLEARSSSFVGGIELRTRVEFGDLQVVSEEVINYHYSPSSFGEIVGESMKAEMIKYIENWLEEVKNET